MSYILTYSTEDEDAYGEFLVNSWENKPTKDQIKDCGISMTFNDYLHKNGKLFLNGRLYVLTKQDDINDPTGLCLIGLALKEVKNG